MSEHELEQLAAAAAWQRRVRRVAGLALVGWGVAHVFGWPWAAIAVGALFLAMDVNLPWRKAT